PEPKLIASLVRSGNIANIIVLNVDRFEICQRIIRLTSNRKCGTSLIIDSFDFQNLNIWANHVIQF
ncbi:hypothetical protein, partial [Ruegeria arenilitoris]|uniref:hypothetical protein n=1 Tax=Ruegeria arenilitoris TaxID=1173585 RepID=UPI001C2B8879